MRTSTAQVTILWSVFTRRNILDFLSYKSFPDLRVRVRVYHSYRKPEPGYLNFSIIRESVPSNITDSVIEVKIQLLANNMMEYATKISIYSHCSEKNPKII
jgi:hypothetical protein